VIGTSGMTRNVRGSGEDEEECERNRWKMRGSGEDQEKCEWNRSQEKCEMNRRNVRGTRAM